MVFRLAIVGALAVLSWNVEGQQAATSSQSMTAGTKSGEQSTTTTPNFPDFISHPELLRPNMPSTAAMSAAQGPVLQAAPDTAIHAIPEQGFSNLPAPGGALSISEHDMDKGNDIAQDLLNDELDGKTGTERPSLQSTITDALASGTEKLGNITSSDFLQKTIPTLLKSDLSSGILNGSGVLFDSEPTADASLDTPDSVRSAQSAIMNLRNVATGNAGAFGDANLGQACNRLRSTYAQTRFNLNAAQQNQVQQLISWCDAQANSSVQPSVSNRLIGAPHGASSIKASPTLRPSDCKPGGNVCH